MFGPLHIKLNRKTLKEAQVVMFTCMTTRAVHLELVNDKTSDAFLMAFRRFASLRGHPSVYWSDRGTNFVGAQGYLKEIMQSWNIPRFKVFYLRISVAISSGNGIYLMQVIKMASWKLSSSLSDKVSMLRARIKPLQKSNGEHFCQRQTTSSMDVLCIQVPMTSGKVPPSHQTIFS